MFFIIGGKYSFAFIRPIFRNYKLKYENAIIFDLKKQTEENNMGFNNVQNMQTECLCSSNILLQIFFYFVGIKSSSPASTCVNPPSPPTAPPPPPLTAAVTSTTGERRLSVPGSPKPMLPARSTKPSSNHRQRMITVYRVDALL